VIIYTSFDLSMLLASYKSMRMVKYNKTVL